jgi:hypothetical protein
MQISPQIQLSIKKGFHPKFNRAEGKRDGKKVHFPVRKYHIVVKSDDNAKIIKKRENQKVTRGKYCP